MMVQTVLYFHECPLSDTRPEDLIISFDYDACITVFAVPSLTVLIVASAGFNGDSHKAKPQYTSRASPSEARLHFINSRLCCAAALPPLTPFLFPSETAWLMLIHS